MTLFSQADPDGGSAPHWAPREAEAESSRKLLCTEGQAPAGLRETPAPSPGLRQALPQLGLLSRARSPRPAPPGHSRPQETLDARGGNPGLQDRDQRAAGALGGAVSSAAPASPGGGVAAAADALCQLRPRGPGRARDGDAGWQAGAGRRQDGAGLKAGPQGRRETETRAGGRGAGRRQDGAGSEAGLQGGREEP
nr:translation initiation factor IF-2-like [Macaca fascicularis]